LCNVACHLLGQTIIKIIYFPVSSIIGHFDLRLSDQEFCMDVSSPSVAHAVVPSVTAEAFMEVLYIVIIIILYIMSALSGCIIPCFAQHSCIFSIAAGFCIHPACIVADIIFVIFTLQFCTVFSEGCRMIIGTDVIERHIMDPVITCQSVVRRRQADYLFCNCYAVLCTFAYDAKRATAVFEMIFIFQDSPVQCL